MATLRLRVFLSSPGDVGLERLLAVRVLERLQGEFAAAVVLEPILWEDLPLRATEHFQEQIVPPSQTDIVVAILWSRLGTRLPADKFRRADGSPYQSGTEWEFEDAVRSYQERGTPDLFVYRKTSEPQVSLNREDEIAERLRQKKALDAFVDHWFGNPNDSFKAAFTTFETPDQFEEKLESHLRATIRERLPSFPSGEAPPTRWYRGSPFRRLEVFEFEHAPIFFGRTQAIGAVCDAITRQARLSRAFVLVLGMSGCGKSSLVRAGVLPVLTQSGIVEGVDLWRRCVFRPGDSATDPLDALAHGLLSANALPELEALSFPANVLAEHLRRAPHGADGPVRMALARVAESAQTRDRLPRRPEARLAVVVDQLEETFTRPLLSTADREKFLSALAALARSGVAWVVATMRSDFYARCAELPELVALKEGTGQYDLLPPTLGETGRIIRHPATAAGLAFEEDPATGRRLDEALHESAFKNPQSLPLLEFTLDELYRRRTATGQLTWSAYRALGGLEGAIGHYAESVFQDLDPAVQPELPALLRALVTVGTSEGEPVGARRAPREAVAATEGRTVLLDDLIKARLVVTDSSPDGAPTVSLAHEALLRHWDRLSAWVQANRKELNVHARVATSLERWREGGRTADLLLPDGAPLEEGLALLRSWGNEIPEAEREFISLSADWARRNRRLKRIAVAALAALTLVAVVSTGVASREAAVANRARIAERDALRKAQDQARKAENAARLANENEQKAKAQARLANARRIAAFAESEREKRLDRSLILAVEALGIENTYETRNSLFDTLYTRPEVTSFLHTSEGDVKDVAFSPDGNTLAVGYGLTGSDEPWSDKGGGVVLWDIARRKRLPSAPFFVTEGPVTSVALSPDGQSLAAGFSTPVRRPADGIQLLTGFLASGSGGVVLWDVSRQERSREKPLVVAEGYVECVAFSPDGKTLAASFTAGFGGGGVVLWDAARRERLSDKPLVVPEGNVKRLAFSSDSKTLAAGINGGFTRGGTVLWDLERRQRLTAKPLGATQGYVECVAFSPDGKTLVTVIDGDVVFWDVPRQERLAGAPLAPARGWVKRVALSPDGKILAGGCRDSTGTGGVVLWDMARRERTPDNALVLAERPVNSVAFSPDGTTLVVGYEGRRGNGGSGVVVWDMSRRERLVVEKTPPVDDCSVESVAFSPSGKTIAVGCSGKNGGNQRVVLWNRDGGRHLPDKPLVVEQGVVYSLAFSPDGKTLAAGYVGSDRDGVILWDVPSHKRLGVKVLDTGVSSSVSVALSPDGKTVAVGHGYSTPSGVLLWEVLPRQQLGDKPIVLAEEFIATRVAFSPDGRTLAAGYWKMVPGGNGVHLWDVGRRQRLDQDALTVAEGIVSSVAFSPDNRILAAGYASSSVGGVVFWDRNRRQRLPGKSMSVQEGEVSSLAFSPDGRILAAGYSHGTVLWDVARGERVVEQSLTAADLTVHSVAFSSDGKTLGIGYLTDNGGVVLLDVDPESWKDRAGRIANRNLTREEWRQYFPETPYHATFSNLPEPTDERPTDALTRGTRP
jgi:WD40 repeat protein